MHFWDFEWEKGTDPSSSDSEAGCLQRPETETEGDRPTNGRRGWKRGGEHAILKSCS